ncbi:peptide/nickel transport system ATP-binding protein/oligopeptide transport system ATP-binding protein [Arthrobacter ginsengisoli]|uniref:Peptide/nickel transport system ATP-binding protein/oligopeptide transport system ATP-binding protein n=1 Tax=Arthrobacter ginsengisoli TaxID=1356565 RepID=A0ABU1UG59_9MICC|nr:ABC transporter ATP-binding protein [Arthrobacter ginsengisoli]MDR7084143.1 peptide/nickel transport system ATP-binding protein/oligopeptide transport system ATP-binding protein [Arthrobacter ginsengisoli]
MTEAKKGNSILLAPAVDILLAPAVESDKAPEPVVSVRDLSVEFATERGWQRVINNVSLDVSPGKILGVVGESGSGKSVTSLAMMRLLPKQGSRIAGGSIHIDGSDMQALNERELSAMRGNRMAMIFQEPMTSLNPAFTIGDQIAETVRKHKGVPKKEAWKRAVQSLDDVGIPNAAGRARRYPHEFSGGMRQRAMIAMAISCQPRVLIADEPTTALDVTIQAQILKLLRSMCEDHGLAMMFITHNMGVVADICDDVAVMYAGEIIEQANIYDTFAAPKHPYTEGLLRAVPRLEGRSELASIPGKTPAPWDMPPGCRFQPRCPYAIDACNTGQLPLRQIGDRTSRCLRAEDLDLKASI